MSTTTVNQNTGFNVLFNSSKSSLNFEKILSGIGSVFFFKFISENNNFVLCALWIVYAVIIYATVAEIKKFNQTKFTIYCCSAWFFLLAFLFLFTDFSVVKNIGPGNRSGTGNRTGNSSSSSDMTSDMTSDIGGDFGNMSDITSDSGFANNNNIISSSSDSGSRLGNSSVFSSVVNNNNNNNNSSNIISSNSSSNSSSP